MGISLSNDGSQAPLSAERMLQARWASADISARAGLPPTAACKQ
jgi:hypothetical protein